MAELNDAEKAVLEQFERPGAIDPDPEALGLEQAPVEELEVPAPEGEQEPPAEEAPPEDEWVDVETIRIGDRDVPAEDIRALLEFQQWSQENQDKMAAFGQYLRGEADFVQHGQQPAPQEQAPAAPQVDWELVDPEYKKIYDQQQAELEAFRSELGQLRNPIQAWQQQQVQEAQRLATEQVNRATSNINEKFGLDLNEKELDELQTTTARLNILPGLRQSIADPVEAIETALEMAVWQTPKYRDRIVQNQVQTERANDKRALAGRVGSATGSERSGLSSGSSSEDVRKMTQEERTKAMAAEIAESLRGTP